MPVFRYKAVSPAGEVSTGELDAANEGEIVGVARMCSPAPASAACVRASSAISASTSARRSGSKPNSMLRATPPSSSRSAPRTTIRPRAIVFGELPKTSTGKIQKFVLREKAKSASAIE